LACQSFDEEMLTKDLKGPLDDLSGLDEEAMDNLQSWEDRFLEKYLVVGKLVAEGDPEAPKA
jgi:membrane-associated progesterone receptor component